MRVPSSGTGACVHPRVQSRSGVASLSLRSLTICSFSSRRIICHVPSRPVNADGRTKNDAGKDDDEDEDDDDDDDEEVATGDKGNEDDDKDDDAGEQSRRA